MRAYGTVRRGGSGGDSLEWLKKVARAHAAYKDIKTIFVVHIAFTQFYVKVLQLIYMYYIAHHHKYIYFIPLEAKYDRRDARYIHVL